MKRSEKGYSLIVLLLALSLATLLSAACQARGGEEMAPTPTEAEELTYEEFRSTTPPPPENLRATFTSKGVRLDWEPAPGVQTEDEYRGTIMNYNVYRRAEGEVDYSLLALTGEDYYIDGAIKEDVIYNYAVSAVYEGPVEGERTEEVTPAEGPGEGLTYEEFRSTTPPAPQNLRATFTAEGVRLDWEPALAVQMAHLYSDRVQHYNVWRRAQGGESTLLDTTSANYYMDTTASQGVIYYYAVSAVHEGPVEGERTEEVTPAEGPVAPPEQQETGGEASGVPNPASEYCIDQGGTLEIRTDESGNEYGVCILPDGRECEEWAFFRGECP